MLCTVLYKVLKTKIILHHVPFTSLKKALIMAAKLKYVPVPKPITAKRRENKSNKYIQDQVLEFQFIAIWHRGGKTRANAVLETAPNRDMNNPSCGTTSAAKTEIRIK